MQPVKTALEVGLVAGVALAKPWWESRTIWFNLVSAALYGLDKVKDLPVVHQYAANITVILIFGNLFWRVITDSAIQRGGSSTTITAIDPATAVNVTADPLPTEKL